MKRSAWIRNKQEAGQDRVSWLIEEIIKNVDYFPEGINPQQNKLIKNILKNNRDYFSRSLRNCLAKAFQKLITVPDILSTTSYRPCHEYFVVQLWKTGPRMFTLNVIFHPSNEGINCISVFQINAEDTTFLEVSKMQGFLQTRA